MATDAVSKNFRTPIQPLLGVYSVENAVSTITAPSRVGYGSSKAHFGEIFQGQVKDELGNLRRCLVTLPCKELQSHAIFIPDSGGQIAVDPSYKLKAKRAVEITLKALSVSTIGGKLIIESNIKDGKGNGGSTADCVAAALAAADTVNNSLREDELARLVVEAEGASDSTMFSQAVLFAQREGAVLEYYPSAIPSFEVLGVDTDVNGSIDTLLQPCPSYSLRELRIFETLRTDLTHAIRTHDIKLLARVATASAIVNERVLPKPLFAEIRALAYRAGALGVAVAHSGTILAILLNPYDDLLERRIDTLESNLRKLGMTAFFRFQT